MPSAFVHVIESPTPFDLLNGRTDGQEVCDEFGVAGIAHALHVVADKEMLEIALRLRIATESKRRGTAPAIVFTMYAEHSGLRLTSGELVAWEELQRMLIAVRDAQPNGVLMSFLRGKGGALADLFVRSG